MPWFKHLLARAIRPRVSRHHLSLGDNLDRVDVSFHRQCGKRESSRYAVTVAVEGYHLKLVDLCFLPDASIEAMLGQREGRTSIMFETNANRFALATDDAIAIGFAAPQQIGVQFVEILDLGNRSRPTPL
jgi:Fe2+ transport system protein FeoA